MASYSITIKGKTYDRALYETALQAVERQGDGRISRADAEQLLEKVLDAAPGQKDVYTEVEKRTVRLLREQLNWTPAADEHFRKTVASVAALKGWQTRLAGAGTQPPAPPTSDPAGPGSTTPVVTPPAIATLDVNAVAQRVLAELGLPRMHVDLPQAEVDAQLARFGGAVGFEQALRQALQSFLTNGDDVESPLGLIRETGPLAGAPADPDAAVRFVMDKPTARLELVHDVAWDPDHPVGGYPPEHGERPDNAWCFMLRIEDLSDVLHWAIVDRAGVQPTYNYGFN